MNNQQRFRSYRLRQSYRTDDAKFEDMTYEDNAKEDDLLPQAQEFITIESDEAVAPMSVESESDVVLPVFDQIEEEADESELQTSHSQGKEQQEIGNNNKIERFAKFSAQFQDKLMKNHRESPQEQIEDDQPPPISYQEYKALIMKEFEQQNLEKAKERLKEQQMLLTENFTDKFQKLQLPPEKINHSKPNDMGDFLAKVVSENERKKPKPRGRRKQKSQSPQHLSDTEKTTSNHVNPSIRNRNPNVRIKGPPKHIDNNYSPKQKIQQDQYLADMLKIFNQDRPTNDVEFHELLNYDVLLKRNKIMRRALMDPPRFKDDFYFTHLYQDDAPESPTNLKRRGRKSKLVKQDTKIHYNHRTNENKPQQNTEDNQIKKLQNWQVDTIIGKRINPQGHTEYMCNFIKSRKSWTLQSLLMKDYQDLVLNFENSLKQKQLEYYICNGVKKIKEFESYCLLSHTVSWHKIPTKIVFFKQRQVEASNPQFIEEEDEQEKKTQYDLAFEQQEIADLFQRDRGENQQKKTRKRFSESAQQRNIDDDEDANFFEKQFQMMQKIEQEKTEINRIDQRKQKFIEELASKRQKIQKVQPSKVKDSQDIDMDEFEEEIRQIAVEQEGQLNIQQEMKKLNGSQNSFKMQLQQQRLNKLITEMQSKKFSQDYEQKFSPGFKQRIGRLKQ